VQGQTKTKRQTLNPEWDPDEVFEFPVRNIQATDIRVEVWDWDMMGESEFSGQVTIPIRDVLCQAVRSTAWASNETVCVGGGAWRRWGVQVWVSGHGCGCWCGYRLVCVLVKCV
jgi:hypothetical protein